MYGCHEPYLQIFTHNLALSGSSRLLSRYPLLLLRLRLCSTVQLGLSLWPRELDKPPWSHEDGAGFSIPSSETLLVERVFQEPMWRIAKGSFIDHIFMQSFRVLREGTSPGEILFITDLNTASLVERSLTAAISNISSASVMLECWQNLSKLTNQRV